MLEKFIKNNTIIISLLSISLIAIINNFFRFFQNNTAYQFDPWFSNYQGGFVRRGLPGEIFYQIYSFLGIHPGWIIFFFVSFLYIFFYFNFISLIKNVKINKLYVFAIFSPLSFYFPVLNSKASGHKEILFLFFLSLFCLILPKINKKHATQLIILISIFLSLSYEVLIFYLIYLIIPFIYFFNFKNIKDLSLYLFPIIIVCTFLVFINYHYSGNTKHTIDICNSVKPYVNQNCDKVGKIADLGLVIKGHTSQKANWNYGETSLYPAYYKIYGLGFIIGFLPLLLIYKKITVTKFLLKKITFHPVYVLLLLLLFAFPIYYLGADWGRYLHIAYMSSLIFTFFCINNRIFIYQDKNTPSKNNLFAKIIFVSTLLIYSLGWTVPICCEKNFKSGIFEVIERGKMQYQKSLLNE